VNALRAGAQAHDVRPRETDELGGVVLVLDVVGVGVGVVTLDHGQDPAPVLVGPRDLGRHLLAGPGAELAPLALPDAEGRSSTVKVRRLALVIGNDVHVAVAGPRRLQALQESSDGFLLVHVHALKVPGHRHRQLAGRGVLADGNSWQRLRVSTGQGRGELKIVRR
jgi:hypothetical protein